MNYLDERDALLYDSRLVWYAVFYSPATAAERRKASKEINGRWKAFCRKYGIPRKERVRSIVRESDKRTCWRLP